MILTYQEIKDCGAWEKFCLHHGASEWAISEGGGHCQVSLSSQTLKYDARLNANNGTKTLNPTDAASPMPKKMLKIVSKVINYISKKSSLKPIRYNFSLALVTAVYSQRK